MSTANLDAVDLKDVNLQGWIHEDVMNQIFNISRIPLPFTDAVGSSSHDNQYFSWNVDKLSQPVTTGQTIDGADITPGVGSTGERMGNHSEIRTKSVAVSTRAQEVNSIGFANALAYQITKLQQDLRRDVEATALSNNPSIVATETVAGQTAGLAAWLVGDVDVLGNAVAAGSENVIRGAGGADGGWYATAANSLVAASTPGTAVALTETAIRDVMENVYTKGGDPSVLMTTPAVKRIISEYLFTSSARIATNISQGGEGASVREASGAFDVFLTDFGTLRLVPNRLQPHYNGTTNDYVFIMDPSYLELSYLQGYRTEPLAKSGLSDKRVISVDWGLKVLNFDAMGGVADVLNTAPMTFA